MSKPQEIQKILTTRSERVKMVDMHPKEPLILCALYSGQVTLWNYETKSMVKSFEINDAPVRCVRFITRLQCFACGADDMNIRIFNYNTMEKIKTFQAHEDYIRCLAVHEQLPLLLTSSDDMTIKQWDWSKGWAHTMTYEGHAHYVMSVVFNPKDPTTFATASLDQTVKVWSITTPVPNFSLEGHEEGVNCVEYYPGGDKPYIISGSDDHTVRVWDYQTKACIQVLTHHQHNVTAVFFHPDVPLLFTGGEDETVGVFSTQTWRQENSLNYGLLRCWALAAKPNTNHIGMGFDKGMVVVKVGRDEPIMSMDPNGKVLIALGNDITRLDIKGLSDKEIADGETIPLAAKEVGTTENTPTKILHGPSGQYIAVLTDGEYTINSSLAWRPKAYGQAISFCWGLENGSYAILETPTTVKLFKMFKERATIKLPEPAEQLFAGPALGVKCPGVIYFYDWASMNVVRRIDEAPRIVEWSDSGELVALVGESGFFVLKYNAEAVDAHFQSGAGSTEDGLDFAFDVVEEVDEKVRQAAWVGDCLCFINGAERLSYYIGGEVVTIAVLPRGQYLLGYLPKENRVFCMDRDRNVTSYQLYVSVIEYKTAIVREDFDTAAEVLPQVPVSMRFKVAQFLQARGLLEMALETTTEDDHRFDLAIQLGRLHTALTICRNCATATRWKQVGDLAMEQAYFDVVEEALTNAGDFNGLLLLFTSTSNTAALVRLGEAALRKGKSNVAFTCFHLIGRHAECVDILVHTQKIAEAAFYARTYCHSKVMEVVLKWKNSVAGMPRVRDAIADPVGFPNLFPNIPPAPPAAAPEAPSPAKAASPAPAAETSPLKEASPAKESSPVKEASPVKVPSPVKEAIQEEVQTSSPSASPPRVQSTSDEVTTPKPALATSSEATPAPAAKPSPAPAATPATAEVTPKGQEATPAHVTITPSPAGFRGLPEVGDSTVRRPPAPPPSARKEGDDIDDIFDEDFENFQPATAAEADAHEVPQANFDDADEDWGFVAPQNTAADEEITAEEVPEPVAAPEAPAPKPKKVGKKD